MEIKESILQKRNVDERQIRSMSKSQFRAVDESGKKFLECDYVVFSDIYEFWPGATESFDPHAFDETINDDIRSLADHDSSKVLGRTKSGTLKLSISNYSVNGRTEVNEADTDATNLYARVQRGDVSQCSIGFDILDQEVTQNPDGSVHWLIKKAKLYEVSIVTFPAYEKTEAHARDARQAEVNRRFKETMKERTSKWHSNN